MSIFNDIGPIPKCLACNQSALCNGFFWCEHHSDTWTIEQKTPLVARYHFEKNHRDQAEAIRAEGASAERNRLIEMVRSLSNSLSEGNLSQMGVSLALEKLEAMDHD